MPKEAKRTPVVRPRKKEKEVKVSRDSKEVTKELVTAPPTPKPTPIPLTTTQPIVVDAPAPKPQNAPLVAPHSGPRVSAGPVADYLIETYFDKEMGQWIVTVAEFPELKAIGSNRFALIEEVETRLEDELEILRRRGEPIPEPIYTRTYPSKLEVAISRNLYRKLDVLSRQERVGLETVVSELLTSAMARRFYEGGRSFDKRASSQPPRHQGGQQHQHRHNSHGGTSGPNGNVRNRQYHDSMGNSDNFLEYVRNLEKGGGAPTKWRK